MLCSEFQLVKAGEGWEDIKPLPCRRWACGYCAPRRRRALISQAISGKPNKMLTLTVDSSIGEGPNDRRALLHDAWKKLVKRIIRQFALASSNRWQLADNSRSDAMKRRIAGIDPKTPATKAMKIPYMAFLEKTKLGEPHLHILLRCPFIPQDWISAQMLDMLGSYVCWIEQVRGTAQAVHYVTKYVGKAPAQFGTAKRYYVSRGWSLTKPDKDEAPVFDMTGVRFRRERWEDTLNARDIRAFTRVEQEDGFIRFTPIEAAPIDRRRWQQRPRDWRQLASDQAWKLY
jgi:hypothetical protein